ncbi:hypothetical protein [Algibacter mikhailovii]|uniref:Uncharacterized protein n=1 Tax=Algibacter mikhailovii TaxID=425498 RepID=A0A918QY55_9FLAO|nr:hypothetical protein [Algibacter mikhailovii]GGZ76173.1 hypothetical protein GCM10007028_12170 [Algibacter mikhailovii]
MQLKINGGFNNGLKVYSENDVILFSEVNKKWFKPDLINIYDGQKSLIISIKHISKIFKTEFKIIDQTFDIKNIIQTLKKGTIELLNGEIFEFKKSRTSLITNPYLKIFHRDIEIGILNNKKTGFELNYELSIKDEYENYLNYVLIYILATESNKDYD